MTGKARQKAGKGQEIGKMENTLLLLSTCIGLYHVSGMSRRSVDGKGKGEAMHPTSSDRKDDKKEHHVIIAAQHTRRDK